MAAENLWGDLKAAAASIRTPASILKEIAGQLDKATDYVLIGQVDVQPTNGTITLDLDVRVPALNDYVITLLRCRHTLDLYPVHVESSYSEIKDATCKDAEDFLAKLKENVQSGGVQKVLRSLLAQAKS